MTKQDIIYLRERIMDLYFLVSTEFKSTHTFVVIAKDSEGDELYRAEIEKSDEF
jgi:hypothetical protein